jgi:GDP-mannose 6-dehydrogenase
VLAPDGVANAVAGDAVKRLAVFGLGYVGTVSAACLASRGCSVVGVDVSAEKVDLVNAGRTTVYEAQIEDLIREGLQAGRLRATTDSARAVADTDAALICVGTPSTAAGGLNLDYVRNVVAEIGNSLSPTAVRYEIIVRSTMLPGTTAQLVIPTLEAASGLSAGSGFGVSVNPEFLREGTSVADFFAPPKTVIGAIDDQSASFVAALYAGLPGPVHVVEPAVAELTKYADNSFHALKVAFANEYGAICKRLGIDSHQLMDVFVSDTKLNVSAAYLRPGFAFGGSCLPKDVRAITHFSRHLDVDVPVLESILPSNERHLDRVYRLIESLSAAKVAIYGLAFKGGTDDLRESPTVALAERMLGRGLDLRIYDPQVQMSQIVGANRAYVESRLPHLSRVLEHSVKAVADWADVHVIVNPTDEVGEALHHLAPDIPVIALARSAATTELEKRDGYYGIAW